MVKPGRILLTRTKLFVGQRRRPSSSASSLQALPFRLKADMSISLCCCSRATKNELNGSKQQDYHPDVTTALSPSSDSLAELGHSIGHREEADSCSDCCSSPPHWQLYNQKMAWSRSNSSDSCGQCCCLCGGSGELGSSQENSTERFSPRTSACRAEQPARGRGQRPRSSGSSNLGPMGESHDGGNMNSHADCACCSDLGHHERRGTFGENQLKGSSRCSANDALYHGTAPAATRRARNRLSRLGHCGVARSRTLEDDRQNSSEHINLNSINVYNNGSCSNNVADDASADSNQTATRGGDSELGESDAGDGSHLVRSLSGEKFGTAASIQLGCSCVKKSPGTVRCKWTSIIITEYIGSLPHRQTAAREIASIFREFLGMLTRSRLVVTLPEASRSELIEISLDLPQVAQLNLKKDIDGVTCGRSI